MSTPRKNRLLDALPADVQAKLLPQFEHVQLPLYARIFEPEKAPRYVHFLLSGIASVVSTMEEGEAVEVGLIGSEGFPERIHVLDSHHGRTRCFMQMPGEALRMDFSRFQTLFLAEPTLLKRVLEFVQADSTMLAQLSACNRLHEAEARLARWLLMVCDRVGTNELVLTQEFLSEMLGARRSTVNLVIGSLQRSGFLTFTRGRINIQSREALETVACECSAIVGELFRTLYA